MIAFAFKFGSIAPIRSRMGRDADGKSGSIDELDELRETTRILAAWRAGALVRINRKQVERAVRRTARRRSGEHPAVSIPPQTKR